ncbi:MAG: quinone oxidoreductase [Acidobacteria bacterium]|jgi:NADPH:quinone reductase|nr:quinone oxidoreductase [Acidobacteriota bacterium]
MKAIVVHECGGPEQMRFEDAPMPAVGAGQARVKLSYSGVNFIDIYFRMGLYKADLPMIVGQEACGVVESLGEGVTEVAVGDRVAYAGPRGSYAEYAVVPAWQLVKVPTGVTDSLAAAAMLQGMTAHYLTHSTFPLQQGQTCLVHAAAGGAGQCIVQMAKRRGARVIATVGSEAKAELAREAGADEVILYDQVDFAAETRRLTEGKGVDVVYDSVGASTFTKSIDSLKPRGMMVTFGNASGPVPPVEPLLLSAKGSLFLTRPTLAHHVATREELLWRAGDVLSWIANGDLRLRVHKTYALSEAREAQEDLASRKTTGKLLLAV